MAKRRLGQIGALVRERRGARGVREAAREVGVSSATLSRIENGKQPDLGTFEKLCRWLKINPNEFLDVDDAEGAVREASSARTATVHLRAKREISSELAQALGEMIMRAQEMFGHEPDRQSEE